MPTRERDARVKMFTARVPRDEAVLLERWAEKHEITVADVLLRCVRAVVTAEDPSFYLDDAAKVQ